MFDSQTSVFVKISNMLSYIKIHLTLNAVLTYMFLSSKCLLLFLSDPQNLSHCNYTPECQISL